MFLFTFIWIRWISVVAVQYPLSYVLRYKIAFLFLFFLFLFFSHKLFTVAWTDPQGRVRWGVPHKKVRQATVLERGGSVGGWLK